MKFFYLVKTNYLKDKFVKQIIGRGRTMKYYHGSNKIKQYFEGWYFKQQDDKVTISFIPGIQMDENSCATAFIQIVTSMKSHYITYPIHRFYADTKSLFVRIGENVFTEFGIHLDIDEIDTCGEHVRIKGYFFFGKSSSTNYKIMGPFQYLKLPCKHEIISMYHTVFGKLRYNDHLIKMEDGVGYIETDYGHTFPNDYFWTQFNSKRRKDPQIFASIATIPFGNNNLLGTIALIEYQGRRYRLATYLGAQVLIIRESLAILKQGSYILVIHSRTRMAQELKAPENGRMSRTIRERLICPTRYEFYEGKRKIFDWKTKRASCEYVLGEGK